MKTNRLNFLHFGKVFLLSLFSLPGAQDVLSQSTEHIHGLTVLVDFPDEPGFAPADTFINLINQESGYTGFGWNGSVREYWNDVSNDKLDYTSEVIGWVRAPQNRSYYETGHYTGLDLLVADVMPMLEGMNFSGLTLEPGTNEIRSVNVVIQGFWGGALRPVAFNLQSPVNITNDGSPAIIQGVAASVTKVVNSSEDMEMYQLPHEIGHDAFHWPEYYQQQTRIGNIGNFGLMAHGGAARDENPAPPNPGLRLQQGWIDPQNIISLNVSATTTFTANANDLNQIFKYTNPNNPREYFLVEPYLKQGRYQGLLDEGLAIWYVDEEGGLDLPVQDMVPRVQIMEADGLNQIANGANGDANDLFDASDKNTFSDFTVPNAKWKDGSNSGLNITNISNIGSTMTFTVEVKDYTIQISGGPNGEISPSGTLHVSHGDSQNLQFTPDIGYEVSSIIVNGVTHAMSLNEYDLNNITGNTTVEVVFTEKTSGAELPSPWASTDFGSNVEGEAYYENGKFALKSYGWDIWGDSDNFLYVYQSLSGDGEIIAQVSQDATSEWTKAGVMIREELTDGSEHAFMAITPYNGPAFQYRPVANQGSENSNTWGTDPSWIKLVRTGSTFTGYYSFDGVIWTQQYSADINMDNNVFIGLASTASTDLVKKEAIFENVTVDTSVSNDLFVQYNVPRATPLPTFFGQYSHVHTIGNGGPDLNNVFNSVFNWDYTNNGLWQFSLETTNGNPRWYTGLETYSTNTLNQPNPTITFSNTGFANLDGTYYVNTDGSNLVLVRTTGEYALYFSTSSTPPNARVARDIIAPALSSGSHEITASPSAFRTTTKVDLGNTTASELVIYNMSGTVVERIDSGQYQDGVIELGQNYTPGMYIIEVIGSSEMKTLKIIKN